MMTEEQKLISRAREDIEFLEGIQKRRGHLFDQEQEHLALIRIALSALTQPVSPDYFINRIDWSDDYGPNIELRTYDSELDAIKSKQDHGGDIIGVYRNAPHTAPIEPICATGGAEWVKVSERMPLELSDEHISEVEVIVTDGTTVGTCEYRRGYLPRPWAEWSNYGDIDADKITHWQPMPSAPDA